MRSFFEPFAEALRICKILKQALQVTSMIKIGILDEDKTFADKLYNIIQETLFSIDDWETQSFSSSSDIRSAIKEHTFDCQLLFMDIMIKDGLQTVQYIFSNKIPVDIIFITASRDFVYQSYHYHTFAYLLKPVSEADISLELQRYLNELHTSPHFLPVTCDGQKQNISIPLIRYAESKGHTVIIHTLQQDYISYQKLNELEAILCDHGFVRCHQSFLVSLRHITGSSLTSLQISDAKIPISRRYQPALKELLSQREHRLTSLASTVGEKRKDYGALICTKGVYLGSIIRICPEQTITIGREAAAVDIQINYPLASRLHCELLYHADRLEYEITDYSSNGTYIDQSKRLVPGITYTLPKDTSLCFGDLHTVYKLA